MTPSESTDSSDALIATLSGALVLGTPEAFAALLTDDVHWGGAFGGNRCTSKAEALAHYEGLLASGVRLHCSGARGGTFGSVSRPTNGGSRRLSEFSNDGNVVVVVFDIRSPEPEMFPSELMVRLSLRDGLIADICELGPPPTVELLFFDDCPSYGAFLPHVHQLFDDHGIDLPITLIRVESDEDAHAHRFLGSPTLRVNGRDVDPGAGARDTDENYGLQCRLYASPAGPTGTPPDQWILDALIENPVHEAAIAAVETGNQLALRQLLRDHPELATTRLALREGRTLLLVATDWPAHFPGVATTISVLVAAGADPEVRSQGKHPETPLHWAASSGDLNAINALLDAGADINVIGAVIAGGTPMADATAFGLWDAARLLLERGASTNLFQAAALGLVSRVEAHLDESEPTPDDVTSAFWGACHGGQLDTAAVLLGRGADLNWIGYDGLTPLDAASRADAPDVVHWLQGHGAVSAARGH